MSHSTSTLEIGKEAIGPFILRAPFKAAVRCRKSIPTVSAGADDRPRSEYPMPWGAKYWSKAYVKDPTMAVREVLLRGAKSEALDSN